ncbi:MAG: Glycosyl hydrolase [Candidatus Uhrbacteria bacterium GW2011_GWE2_40_58]|nr:MAG: Glycosyl hydrolase [Candidatus Uhrbacteria bacterium GW2011_GWF2_40_263]KKR67350.1 MAG: Glycosyl hydrolase [Candidatus Uhrbacteria bacterium GW2011_GWE2_40_58]OGL93540.1 MAG: hypothetical protein A2239_02335 [Candidatus Uhrbacteria bacterium RIFOXYA2_FULL_40_9]OGL96650.1 MAG: hypothetical protein A2332_01330 [Candidatus Uhrbacteria bacterium RIFOXYB2_FULL_41_18]HBK34728.1 hypothetical protein [Candidatus Uhrbacteria bacterium]
MRILKLFSLLSLLLFTGVGCFGGSATSSTDGGIFLSADGGDKWQQLTTVLTAEGIGTLATSQVLTMEIDPQDTQTIYVGTLQRGLLYTYDGGVSWMRPRTESLKEGKIRDVEVDPTDECTVYVTKDERLYKTTNCSRDFDSEVYVETRSGVMITRVAVDWYNPDILWLGLSNGDILKSESGGTTWKTSISTGSYITSLLVNNADSRTILAATESDGLYKSQDQGASWTHIEKELSDYSQANYVNFLVQTNVGDKVLAATKYGLISSTDFGSTWSKIDLLSAPGQVIIRALAMDPENADTIYYSAASTFYRSLDGGQTWTTDKLPTTRLPQYLLVNPENPSQVYLSVVTEY